ncbi:DEAD/DEAH box helicase [Pseudomonas syringae pv. broussonetiae]|nr:DEAD/DEAH box helicase [Pseudomonas syringae pv. broussonetiae]
MWCCFLEVDRDIKKSKTETETETETEARV